MDAIDLRLLEALQRDGRATYTELAQLVGLSPPSVAERIKKLEEQGVIRSYTAILDAKRLSLDITAFIAVSLSHPKHDPAFFREISRWGEVLECHHVVGREDYLLKIKVRDTSALEDLIMARLRMLEGVTETRTTIVLSTVKEGLALDLAHLNGH
ncbi:MAG TPA: Lrp/AsnC family transcriptional regulator [Candidatus Fraserbacteria bacterium]|nr:Lrp/AsnC family transcriptional regulator [Candidatus Fraserbacteria bacterium]